MWDAGAVPVVVSAAVTFVPADGDDTVVFNDDTRSLHRLPGTAGVLWAAIDGRRSVAAIVVLLAGLHDASHQVVETDVRAALGRLEDAGLIADATA